MIEKWRDITGYEMLYQVSSLGNVRRIAKYNNSKPGNLKQFPTQKPVCGSAYMGVNLSKNNVAKPHAVHRLVAIAFLGPPPTTKHEVRHLDGHRNNNKVTNLAWGTHNENGQDMIRHGRTKLIRGSQIGISQLTEKQVRMIKESNFTPKQLSINFDVSIRIVERILRGDTWKHV